MPERPSFSDMAKQMMTFSIPLAGLNYAARELGGDTLFPIERLSPYRNNAGLTPQQVQANLDRLPTQDAQKQYLRSLGIVPEEMSVASPPLPGTDVVPIPQQYSGAR